MKFKIVKSGYICGIGTGNTGTAITDEEYAQIMSILSTKPETTATKNYRLKEDLTWEEYEVEPTPEPTDEITADEALSILLGGAV